MTHRWSNFRICILQHISLRWAQNNAALVTGVRGPLAQSAVAKWRFAARARRLPPCGSVCGGFATRRKKSWICGWRCNQQLLPCIQTSAGSANDAHSLCRLKQTSLKLALSRGFCRISFLSSRCSHSERAASAEVTPERARQQAFSGVAAGSTA